MSDATEKQAFSAVQHGSIDDQLGPSAERYFGDGYRKVSHEIVATTIDAQGARFAVSCIYPKYWSSKGGLPQGQHLASVDAMVIAVRMVEEYCSRRFPLFSLESARISRCELRPGEAPVDSSGPVTATLVCSPSLEATCDSADPAVVDFQINFDGFRVLIDLFLPAKWSQSGRPEHSRGSDYYGGRYKDRRLSLGRVALDARGGAAKLDAHDPVALEPGGLESSMRGQISFVDANIIAAQLAQVLIYDLDKIERHHTNTLWLRRASFSRRPQATASGSFVEPTVETTRTSLVSRHGTSIRAASFRACIADIDVQFSLAHTLPS